MISQPSRHCTVELQAAPSRIGQVRRIVSAHLRYWHLDPLIDQASLGVTELLTNVHRHAQPDKTCTVEMELLFDRLTVSVHDHDPRPPLLCEADPSDTGGRGLALIAAVSDAWGVRQDGEEGKTVWFALPTSLPAPLPTSLPASSTAPSAAPEPVPESAPVALTPRPERERGKRDRTARSAAVG
ncbi:ATP-binding protein [Streptomyces sp. NBC_00237]|uniref:ATP-binding protein n=1 Tax=Streptomyces sp. NBC_00237 TaxID=2975687 RepID=UPI002255CB0A|nr:ATP-binding protein [Streptomyces sp. NBC_00237]MCX5207101.1 ATP-binding protein [Streptomyces sp. NBC_00237]